MAQTYAEIQRQIEVLQKQAQRLRTIEIDGVVERIREAIEHYGLTQGQIFGAGESKLPKSTNAGRSSTKEVRSEVASTAAFSDDAGNSWGGRGPRPRWLREAIAAGKLLEEFTAGTRATKRAASTGQSAAVRGKGKGKGKVKRTAKATYRDDAGNSWSGFGPKPGWLKTALAEGRSLDNFAADASKK